MDDSSQSQSNPNENLASPTAATVANQPVNNSQKPRSGFWIIFWLIFFFPVGLYFLWTNSTWSRGTKQIFTGVWGLLIISGFFNIIGMINNSATSAKKSYQNAYYNQLNQLKNQQQSVATATPQPTEDTTLNAEVKSNTVSVTVSNPTTTDMKDCTLSLNLSGGLFSQTSWDNHQDLIAKNSSVSVLYDEFTKSDGTRFDSSTTQPQSLYVSCEVNNANEYSQWTLNQ